MINIGALKSALRRGGGYCGGGSSDAGAGKLVRSSSRPSQLSEESDRRVVQPAGAAFVKTSTGFDKAGATVEDITLMRRIVGPELGVKASGGVRRNGDEAMVRTPGRRQ